MQEALPALLVVRAVLRTSLAELLVVLAVPAVPAVLEAQVALLTSLAALLEVLVVLEVTRLLLEAMLEALLPALRELLALRVLRAPLVLVQMALQVPREQQARPEQLEQQVPMATQALASPAATTLLPPLLVQLVPATLRQVRVRPVPQAPQALARPSKERVRPAA